MWLVLAVYMGICFAMVSVIRKLRREFYEMPYERMQLVVLFLL
jgi:hypothetical protein